MFFYGLIYIKKAHIMSVPLQLIWLYLFVRGFGRLTGSVSFEGFSHVVSVFSWGIVWAAIILVDCSVNLVPKFRIHIDSNCVTCPYKQINKESVMILRNSFKIIHQKSGHTLFPTFWSHSHCCNVTMPLLLFLITFDFSQHYKLSNIELQ